MSASYLAFLAADLASCAFQLAFTWAAFLAASILVVGLAAVRAGHLSESVDSLGKVLNTVNQDTTDLRQESGFLRSQNQDLQDQLTSAGFKIRPDFRAVENFEVADLTPGRRVKVTVSTRNTGGEEATRVSAFFAVAIGHSQSGEIVDRLATDVISRIKRKEKTPLSDQIAKHSDVSFAVDGPVLSAAEVTNIQNGIDTIFVAGTIYYHGSSKGFHMIRSYCGYKPGGHSDFKLCEQPFGRHPFPEPIDFYAERQ
jgi:hypothetical protein